MEASTRKLIRPPLKELQEKMESSKRTELPPAKPPLKAPPPGQRASSPAPAAAQHPPQSKGGGGGGAPVHPPEQTNAENFYFAKQIQMKTPMVVVLRDGEEVAGTVEWYDKHAFRLTRPQMVPVLIYKHNVKYMYKGE